MRMLLLPSRNVGCHLVRLRQQLPVPPAAVPGRVPNSATKKFETVSITAVAGTATLNFKSNRFSRDHQACRRLSTVIAATSTGLTAATCSSNVFQCRPSRAYYWHRVAGRDPLRNTADPRRRSKRYSRCTITTHPFSEIPSVSKL